ncbi:hypothetical protein BVC80_1543g36 [Macleaya cordata]|uniref:Cyclin-dependent kinase inhibitor n=1 Tax=Macleaya cordata TaxID=56857 RepID=A0A200R1K1_MACCD|nr:hypothetical protein BVC80_1543g36 [Macleaya cordata]
MVSLCRAEDLPSSSSATFPKLLEISEGGVGGDRTHFSITDEEATVTGKRNETKAEEEFLWSREVCTTPTAKEYRIPEMLTCPPAPKKRRDSSVSRLTSVRLKEYFVPPPNFETIFVLDKVSTVK